MKNPLEAVDALLHNDKERRVTWIELFFDLVFVAAISVVLHNFSSQVSWPGFAEFLLFFMPIMMAWIGFTFYANRFDSDDAFHRIVQMLQMVGVVGMAAYAHEGIEHGFKGFVYSYLLVLLLLIFAYIRTGKHLKKARPLTTRYAATFALAGTVWFVVAQNTHWIPFLVPIAMSIEYLSPFIWLRISEKFPLNISHLPERVGLFSIILLGESVAGIVKVGIAEGISAQIKLGALLAMALTFCFWWLYFDHQEGGVMRSKDRMARQLWTYTHLPWVFGLAFLGIGIEKALHNIADPDHAESLTILAIACVLIFLSFAVFKHLAIHMRKREWENAVQGLVRFGAAVVVAVLGFSSIAHEPFLLLGSLVILSVAVIMTDSVFDKE